MSIKVTETKVIEVLDSNGKVLHKGYPIILRIKGEDIVCRFQEIANGYFVTETLDGKHENKYRQASIDGCVHISEIYDGFMEGLAEGLAEAPATATEIEEEE